MIWLGAVLAGIPADQISQRVVDGFRHWRWMGGGLCLLARGLRFNLVANFLSRPILTGFMTRISLSILVGQIGPFTGVKMRNFNGLLLPVVELMTKLSRAHWPSVSGGRNAHPVQAMKDVQGAGFFL